MHAALLVPDLVWPHTALARDLYTGLDAPALRRLAALGSVQRGAALGTLDWLGERYGVRACAGMTAGASGVRPLAPYTLAADGVDPGDRHWLRADPVHLRPDRDTLVLMPRASLRLDAGEAQELVADLRRHLGGDAASAALELLAPRPDRWYLGMIEAARIATTPVAEAEGSSIAALLARGPDARRWHALVNDLEMLLHAHPVNRRRESRGDPPVNSLWLWGGGRYAALPAAPYASVAAADDIAPALALATGATATGLPESAADWLATLATGAATSATSATAAAAPVPVPARHLVCLDALSAPARAADGHGWRTALAALERDWFAPLAAALDQGRIGSLVIEAPGARLLRIEAGRASRWRLRQLWRRPPGLEGLLARDAGRLA